MRVWEIDPESGLFVADVLDVDPDECGPHHITIAPPDGLRWPKWEGKAPDQGKWVEGKPLTLEEARAALEREIRAEGQRRLLVIAAPYEPAERESWWLQLAESEQLQADPAASTPLLDAMATHRGLEKKDLATRVIANAAAFRVACGAVLGQQQALLDRLFVAGTIEEAQAIIWKPS
jgi:hypothetical protein